MVDGVQTQHRWLDELCFVLVGFCSTSVLCMNLLVSLSVFICSSLCIAPSVCRCPVTSCPEQSLPNAPGWFLLASASSDVHQLHFGKKKHSLFTVLHVVPDYSVPFSISLSSRFLITTGREEKNQNQLSLPLVAFSVAFFPDIGVSLKKRGPTLQLCNVIYISLW